jgi:RHS repeat-associated protein
MIVFLFYLLFNKRNYLKTEIKEEENSWKRVGTYDKISYEYDKAGNLVQRADTTFKWDSNNRLIESRKEDKTTEYKYDPLGRRISKETDGKITNFYWEGNKLISDTERDYHYYPYSFEPLAMETKDKLYYYHNDINGAPLRLTDEAGNIVWNVHYDIFGKIDKISKNEIDNPIRMQGQYEDEETGLYYNRFRYYDPVISAYVSQDPLGLGAGENVYSYTLNSFGWCDPLGLACIKNKVDGTAREQKVQGKLEGKFGKENVMKERYLRDSNGKIVRDSNGSARRVDFVVKGADGKGTAIEVTSKTADKTKQMMKEENIRDLGGTFVRDPKTKELIEVRDISRIFKLN